MVTVRLFASFREAAGSDTIEIAADAPTTVAAVRDELVRRHPSLAGPFAGGVVLAVVNRKYATGETQVADGDEVAFLPPVSGG
jgi:molybdopterin converting factor subunit 1